MKKIIIIAISLFCVLFLASCNIADKINAYSDQLKSNILDMAGQFIEKDTSKGSGGKSPIDSDLSSDDASSAIKPDNPDVPDKPELPPPPEYVVFERGDISLDKYIGFDFTVGSEHKHRYAYGFGRQLLTLDKAQDADALSYFNISGIESAVQIDFDLALAKNEANEGELSFNDIAYSVGAFANKFASQSVLWMYSTTRVEIGSNVDEKISASDYALLLNTIYDGNCKELSGVGTTFINPELKLITGAMSQINLDYIKELMREIEALRTDAYLPVGGWSFMLKSNGLAPEAVFFNAQNLQELINYRNQNYESIEIYLNGLGWDTVNQESPNYIAPKNGYTSEELQCAYLLRSFMLSSSFGVDRLSITTLKDTEGNKEGIVNIDGTKKVAYGVLEYFKEKATDMSFVEIGSFADELSAVYQDENGNRMYAMWSNGSDKSVEIPQGLAQNITVCTYDSEAKAYVENQVTTDGSYSLTVGEMPTFICFSVAE